MKKLIAILLTACMLLTLSGCGKKEEAAVETTAEVAAATSSDQSAFTWQIEVRASEAKDKLHTDEGVQQYDGGVLDVAHDNVPNEGNVYLILTLTVKKAAAGGGSFDWAKLQVKDASGNAYARMENDSFLSSHTYNRMPGTALQIGENKGSICFEIPADAAKGALSLNYDAGEQGMNTIVLQ